MDATGLVIDAARDVLTAEVRGRRVPLLRLDLDVPRAAPAAGEAFTVPGRASVIGSTNVSDLGVDVLREGLPLGRIEVSAQA